MQVIQLLTLRLTAVKRIRALRIRARYITGKGLKTTGKGLVILYASAAGQRNQKSSKAGSRKYPGRDDR